MQSSPRQNLNKEQKNECLTQARDAHNWRIYTYNMMAAFSRGLLGDSLVNSKMTVLNHWLYRL